LASERAREDASTEVPRPAPVALSRRQFLVRTGVAGAGAYALLSPSLAWAGDPLSELLDKLAEPALQELARDTIAGVVVFQVPGSDRYSRAQGVTSTRPGGIDADAQDLLMHSLDYFLPVPDSYAQALAASFTTAISDQPIPLDILERFGALGEQLLWHMDDALRAALDTDAALPLSLPIALSLNFLATSVDPGSVAGAIPASPFASLGFEQKGEVFRRLEQADPDLVATLDSNAPQPFKGSASGLLRFVGGALLEFASFTSYAESSVFEPGNPVLSSRPVGWDLSNYMPGRTTSIDGWDEFKGYFQGRRQVRTAARYRRGGERAGRA
jgi:hypothetical protein